MENDEYDDEYTERLQSYGQYDAPVLFTFIAAIVIVGLVAFVRMF